MVDFFELRDKLRRYRELFNLEFAHLAERTGIDIETLVAIEAGTRNPTGDELLIFSDVYHCDYKFFLSNERLAPIEQTEVIFRKYGDEIGDTDRWAIQELLFLCETEAFLQQALNKRPLLVNSVAVTGDYFKGHGIQAAKSIRHRLGYPEDGVPGDLFKEFRRLGIHMFRRPLANSTISGLFVNHPTAGPCVLVNYVEDQFRQRFTVAHEVGHSIFDSDQKATVSFVKEKHGLRETRANTFASAFLVPDGVLSKMASGPWTEDSVRSICLRLMVNPQVLGIALKEFGAVDELECGRISSIRLPTAGKRDAELAEDLTSLSRQRRQALLDRGLSHYYLGLCFEAYRAGVITLSRLSEVLLCDLSETSDLMASFNEVPQHGN